MNPIPSLARLSLLCGALSICAGGVVAQVAPAPATTAPATAAPAPGSAAPAPVITGTPVELPAGVTETQVLDRLRQSGLTREAARARLVQMGQDPAAADPYFDRLEGRSNQPVQGSPDAFARVLQQLAPVQTPTPLPDSGPPPQPGGTSSRIFGRAVFAGGSSQFQSVSTGPVDAGYRLGPGDQLTLVLTGGVELAYTLDVTREGFVVIPDVGQIFVSGLTLESLRNQLYERLGNVYSGVRRSGATTFFDISLGRLRTNQISIIGDAVRPGAYQVSSVATVFNALYLAGGPSDLGSFRRVLVRRGGPVVSEVDLYDYLISGDASRDVRLDQGDIVFVPSHGPHITINGRVRRPGIYELKDGEGLQNAITFAGGFEPDAHIQRIQIDRVLPPSERRPGVDRVILDVDVSLDDNGLGSAAPLRDGDEVTVFATSIERRNRVTLSGAVYRPGLYEYSRGMTVWDLIQKSDGLAGDAFRPVAHVIRPTPAGNLELLRLALEPGPGGRPTGDFALADGDEVVIYSSEALATPKVIRVEGWVKKPGIYPFAEGATVHDLILAAGGFQEGAEVSEAEVSRLRIAQNRSDTISTHHAIALENDLPASWSSASGATVSRGAIPDGSFEIQEGDRVFIRQMPGYVTQRTVTVNGEVVLPGPYAVQLRDERLSSVIARAGGITDDASVKGARLTRNGLPVAVDLEQALRRRGSRDDIVVEEGDVIIVPRLDPTVTVTGAVAFASRVIFQSGQSVQGYLSQAGGLNENGDLKRVSVTYPSGERSTVKKTMFFTNFPSVEPGSVIFVPTATAQEGVDWTEFFTRTLSITGSLLTVLLAASKL